MTRFEPHRSRPWLCFNAVLKLRAGFSAVVAAPQQRPAFGPSSMPTGWGAHGFEEARDAFRYLVRAGCDRTVRWLPRRLDWSRSRSTRTRVATGVRIALSQPQFQQCSRDLILGGSATGDCSRIPSPANGYNFFSL